MNVFDGKSCRICLSPNSAFVNVFGLFHERSVEKIIFDVTRVKLSNDKRIPQCICEACLSKLLLSESIRKLCTKNEKFLTDLAKAASCAPADEDVKTEKTESILGTDTNTKVVRDRSVTPLKIEVKEQPKGSAAETFDWEPFLELNEKSKSLIRKPNTSFFCTHCFKDFNTRAKCLYHEKSHHQSKTSADNVKPFTCDRCGLPFKNKSHVMNHLNNVHLKIKRYQCNICGFAMYSKTHHTIHMKAHSNVREFKCTQCGKDFSRKESLLVHQRTHTNERPYKCKFCDRSYTAHTDLKRHMFTHTHVHPYICQLCNGGFFLKRLLFEHVSTAHSGIDTTSWLTGKTFHNF